MAESRFADLPLEDPLRLKLEARILENNQNEIYKHLQLLKDAQEMWAWWKREPQAALGVKQRQHVERILWWKLKQRTDRVNHAISQLYGEESQE